MFHFYFYITILNIYAVLVGYFGLMDGYYHSRLEWKNRIQTLIILHQFRHSKDC